MAQRFWYRFVVVLLFCVMFLALPVAGAEYTFENAYVQSGMELETLREILAGPIDTFSLQWDFRGDISRVVKLDAGEGLALLRASGPENGKASGYMQFTLKESIDLSGASSLAFGISVDNGYNTAASEGEPEYLAALYRVELTLRSGTTVYTSHAYIEGGKWNAVCCDFPVFPAGSSVDSIVVRITYDSAYSPREVQMTALAVPSANRKDSAFVTRFSAAELNAVEGSLGASSHWLNLLPDTSGFVTVEGQLAATVYTPSCTKRYLAVTVVGTAKTGTLAAGALYAGEESWRESASVDILQGTHTYWIPLPEAKKAGSSTLYGGQYDAGENDMLTAYRLSFRGVYGEQTAHFRVTDVQIWEGNGLSWEAGNLGNVTEITVQDGKLLCRGKLTRQAVIDYIDDSVVLQAVPVWNRYTLENAVTLAKVRVSNNFSVELPMPQMETYAAGWLFYTAILLPDGTTLPISQPQMLSGENPEACNLSLFGFHGANEVGVFESNVSHITIDVKLNELILPLGNTGVVCSFSGVSCSLSPTVLSALDSEIQFFTNAGMEVCLRIDADEPFGCSDKTAASYLPLSTEEKAVLEYSAVVSYLCRRYPAVSSIALGSGINCEKYMGISMADPVRAMERAAALTALTYQIARTVIPDIYIVVPLSDGHIYSSESVLPDHGAVISPETALLLLADALQSYGRIPYVVSYTFESDDTSSAVDTLTLIGRVKRVLGQMGLPMFGDFMYLWEPEDCLRAEPIPYNLAERYWILCHTLAVGDRSIKPRAVTLSLARIADYVNQEMYADIQQISAPDGSSLRQVVDSTVTLYAGEYRMTEYSAAVSIWDFSDAYQVGGFVPSQGISSLQTAYSPLLSGEGTHRRVLRSTVPVTLFENSMVGTASGILLRNFSEPVDLSQVDTLSFTFVLSKDISNAAPVKLVFMLGAEDWRAEYVVTDAEPGQVMTAVCDLAGYEPVSRTEYIGVILYGEGSLTFDLSSVRGYSSSCTEEELAAVFTPVSEAEKTEHFAEILYVCVLLGAVSVCIFVLMARWEREEESKGEAEHSRK